MIQSLEAKLRGKLDEIGAKLAVKQRIEKELIQAQLELDTAKDSLSLNEEAGLVLGAVEVSQQHQLKVKLEKIVTYALTVIFERPYQFILDFTERGSQAEVHFRIQDEYGTCQNIRDAHGGGLLVVAAYLLRVIVLMSAKPAMRRLLVMDEPLVQVSSEYRTKLAEFMQTFAQSADMQLLIVTHDADFAAIGDKVYRFRLVDGYTKAESWTA